jgi:hypothetical protein
MMRTHHASAGGSSGAGWCLAAIAAIVILVQASWLHSLRSCPVPVSGHGTPAYAHDDAALLAVNATTAPPCVPPGGLSASRDATLYDDAAAGAATAAAEASTNASAVGAVHAAAYASIPSPPPSPAYADGAASTSTGTALSGIGGNGSSSGSGAVSCVRTPPRVLLVTAEQPTECSTAAAQWLGARAMRNRMQYAQAHGYKLYWNTDNVDPTYPGIQESGMWNKVRARRNGTRVL